MPTAPRSGDSCPECGGGTIRYHAAPGGQAHRFCTVCPATWMLPNRFARKAEARQHARQDFADSFHPITPSEVP